MRSRKTRKDSAEGQLKANIDSKSTVPIPEGINFETDEEKLLWRQFTNARASESWREFDLVIIAKMVKLEHRIRKHCKTLDETEVVIENKRGTMIENPLIRVIDSLQRQQLSMIRSLSLGVQSNRAVNLNGAGKKKTAEQHKPDTNNNDVVSLLAH